MLNTQPHINTQPNTQAHTQHQLDVLHKLGIGLWVPRFTTSEIPEQILTVKTTPHFNAQSHGMQATDATKTDSKTTDTPQKAHAKKYADPTQGEWQPKTKNGSRQAAEHMEKLEHNDNKMLTHASVYDVLDNADSNTKDSNTKDSNTKDNNIKENSTKDCSKNKHHSANKQSTPQKEDAAQNKKAVEVTKSLHDNDMQVTINWYAVIYQNWILVVDDAQINHEALGELWRNIQLVLGGTLSHLSFPPAAELSSHTLNASLDNARAAIAGWVHRLSAQTDRARIGLLTTVDEALQTEDMQPLPTLNQMLANPLLKRQLWQIISRDIHKGCNVG